MPNGRIIIRAVDHFASLILKCSTTQDLRGGTALHSRLIKTAFTYIPFITNSLVSMYATLHDMDSARRAFDDLHLKNLQSWNTLLHCYCKMGMLDKAHHLFHEMPERSLVSYNSLMSGLSHHEFHRQLIDVLKQMQREYGCPCMDNYTVVCIARACASLCAREFLRQVHGLASVIGLEHNKIAKNALIDAYGKCGDPNAAYRVFNLMSEKDVVSWTSVLVAYAKASRLDEAYRVFNLMPVKTTVSWTALVMGVAKNGRGIEALNLYRQMLGEGIQPNASTFVTVLSACADMALAERGRQIHAQIVRRSDRGDSLNVFMVNALIDMYSKCSKMEAATHLFERMKDKDIVSWNSMITGFAQNGQGDESLTCFRNMLEANVKPNKVTFLGVLSACCHTGRVTDGLELLDSMRVSYGLDPDSDHYAIVIDSLGRKNELREAMNLIKRVPNSDHVGVWGALLGACRVYGNSDVAAVAAEALFALEPENAGRYVMLSNIYTAAGHCNHADQVRKLMRDNGLRKEAGYSWIEVRDCRHEFMAKDRGHCCREEIYDMIETLLNHMQDSRYESSCDSSLCSPEDA